jgi:hypothetical protein
MRPIIRAFEHYPSVKLHICADPAAGAAGEIITRLRLGKHESNRDRV